MSRETKSKMEQTNVLRIGFQRYVLLDSDFGSKDVILRPFDPLLHPLSFYSIYLHPPFRIRDHLIEFPVYESIDPSRPSTFTQTWVPWTRLWLRFKLIQIIPEPTHWRNFVDVSSINNMRTLSQHRSFYDSFVLATPPNDISSPLSAVPSVVNETMLSESDAFASPSTSLRPLTGSSSISLETLVDEEETKVMAKIQVEGRPIEDNNDLGLGLEKANFNLLDWFHMHISFFLNSAIDFITQRCHLFDLLGFAIVGSLITLSLAWIHLWTLLKAICRFYYLEAGAGFLVLWTTARFEVKVNEWWLLGLLAMMALLRDTFF